MTEMVLIPVIQNPGEVEDGGACSMVRVNDALTSFDSVTPITHAKLHPYIV